MFARALGWLRKVPTFGLLLSIAVAACENAVPIPDVEHSSVAFPTAAATTLPEGARETGWMRLLGGREGDTLVAYEVPDSDGDIREYCVQFVSALGTPTACDARGDGDLTIVQGRTQRGGYVVVIDPQGRIAMVEVQAGGCRWANIGLEDGHVSWVEFLSDRVDRIAVLADDASVLHGERLPSGLREPGACIAR